ncbi:helix-turn-helix domain-containing protein [Streptomyces zhihengii]
MLDAARATAAESGWDAVSLNTVAVRAQVSRPSVYKEFHSRHGLAEALAQEEAASFLAEIAAVLESPAASPVPPSPRRSTGYSTWHGPTPWSPRSCTRRATAPTACCHT